MFNFGINNQTVIEDFSVISAGAPIIGLIDSDFTKSLYNPSAAEVSSVTTVTISELGNGDYRATFIPDAKGTWYLVVKDNILDRSQGGTIQVYDNTFDTLSDEHKRILGLIHENIYIDNTQFDANDNLFSSRLRIYANSGDVGTDSGVLATYEITAVTTGPGKFTSWKQIRT